MNALVYCFSNCFTMNFIKNKINEGRREVTDERVKILPLKRLCLGECQFIRMKHIWVIMDIREYAIVLPT